MDLHQKLHSDLKSLDAGNVYFQPPPNTMISYPCIVYEKLTYDLTKADGLNYIVRPRYQLTYISRDPVSPITLRILEMFPNSSHDNHFVSDNLYQDVFTIYF